MNWRLRQFPVFLIALTIPADLWAQNDRGSINGVVKDTSGAVVRDATVTVTLQNTGVSAIARSQADGSYLVPNLLPGEYTIFGDSAGFKRLVVSGLGLNAGTTLTQDLVLQVGAANETVTVSVTTSLVETTTNMGGTTIDSVHLLELPLADRQIFGLVNLVPGVYFTRLVDNPAIAYLSGTAGPGTKAGGVLALLDGMDNGIAVGSLGAGAEGAEVQPPPDTLQEFRVQSNNLSAEYGHAATVVLNAVSKSGTNQFHGDLYYYLRNSYFDAAGWGNALKPILQQNVPGGTIGGPIRKNKTFFFFAYEKLFNNLGTSITDSVGLPVWRTGDFSTATRDAGGSAVVVPIYDPATKGTQVFPGNVIPPSRLNPVAMKALAYVPLPNQAPLDPFNNSSNFQVYPASPTRQPFYLGRVDQDFGANTKLYFRYLNRLQDAIRYSGNGGAPEYGALQSPQHTDRNAQSSVLNLTHLFSPTFFVNFLVGVQRGWFETGNVADPNTNYPQLLGVGTVAGKLPPTFAISGGLVPFDQFGGGTDRLQTVTTSNYPVNFTKVMGSHTLKFGFQYERFNNNFHTYNTAAGQFNFNGTYTQGIGANGLPLANTGINLADFVLGYYSSVSISAVPTYGLRMELYAGYFQDDWRVTPSLTLNLGLRYETISPPTSPTQALQSFDPFVPNPGAGTGSIPAGATGITTFQNVAGQGKYLWDWNKKDGFSPRFGFAYRVGGGNNTVIRGGFGIFFDNALPSGVNTSLGFSQTFNASYTANTNPSPVMSLNAVPPGVVTAPPASALGPTFGDIGTQYAQSGLSFYYPNRANPYSMQFNLNVQHQWRGILFEIGYLGNLGRHLPFSQNVNVVPPQLLSQTTTPLALRRPFTQFTGSNASVTSAATTVAVSDYHALNLKSERRYNNGFSWIVGFTWSKWINNADFNGSGAGTTNAYDAPGIQNYYNLAGEKALSNSDVPYRLVFSPIVELPFGKGKRWLNQGGLVNSLVGAWQMALMATLQGGSPLGPTVLNGGNNILGDPAQVLRPNLVVGCNPNSPNQWQPATGGVRGIQYLNASCFTTPAPFTYGNQSRELPNVRGPGITQFNFEVSKSFVFYERYRLQFKVEAVDLFNTPTFAVPAESLGGGNFGIITASDGFTRRIMDFALKFYF